MNTLNKIILYTCVSICCIFSGLSADTVENGCMQDIAGFNLNCTANDVQIAEATNITILDDGCAFPGDTVTFTADFTVVVTAKERYDVGLYFATDGDPNGDGAISGMCSISTLPYEPDPPWLDLDGTDDDPSGIIQDLCGDIDKPKHNPLFPQITITAQCIDTDNDGFLNLPNCTSWRQKGANELCLSPTDAFPGSPSKCRCDDAFNVPIEVPPAELKVTKTATPTNLDEPGGVVTFSVEVKNEGVDPNNNVTLNSLLDDIYGDITTTGHDGIVSTTCMTGVAIAPGGTYSCQFTVNVSGNGGDNITDTVTASGTDDRGNAVSGIDDATVTIDDVLPSISVSKTANPSEVLEPGDDVTFKVFITNNSVSSDPVTINSLLDDIYGDLDGQGDCSVPQTIDPGDTYMCSFTVFVGGNAGDSQTDIVTASGTDDEGNSVEGSDSATVTINDVPSMIELIKTADPTSVDEPGGDVTYTYTINNTSKVDTVTIDTLTDDILGDLNGQGDCSVPQDISPGGSYSCSVTVFVEGNASDAVTNVGTASGIDDDGNPVEDMDDATVNFNNVPPAASLTKKATMAVVIYEVSVTNDSTAEALTLDSLIDDKFGDVTQVQGNVLSTTCSVPQTIGIGETYTCTFDGKVNESPHVNTVTGTVSDDDGSTPITPSDSASVNFE